MVSQRSALSSTVQQIVFQEYVNAVTEARQRLQRLNEQIEVFVKQWRLYLVVEALMSFLGLTPSEYSSGERQSRGRITRTGNGHMRRILIMSQ